MMLTVTMVACLFFAGDMLALGKGYGADGSGWNIARLVLFISVVLVLVYGNLVYQITRLGYFLRQRHHRPQPFEDVVECRWQQAPPVAILVPSFKEDLRTIRQTLMSAALQHYPARRVVLLLDDPPHPTNRQDAEQLAAARQVPGQIAALLREPALRLEHAERDFLATMQGAHASRQQLLRLLDVYADVIAWFDRQATETTQADHTDAMFVRLVFNEHADLLRSSARRLAEGLADHEISADVIRREYRRLSDIFRVELTCFERKRYRNLSQEPNKAANLNGYISLLGKRVKEVAMSGGFRIEASRPGSGNDRHRFIPDATYVLTLDADSLLMPQYVLRLVDVMESPGNERIAVIQSPYTAIPHAPSTMERIAGATTDMQYIVHQGFTWCKATYWVGANAILRKTALDDIRTENAERGLLVPMFIQDRTVIEDTESTVDLIARGWRLHNYPERLAYSATPPDFGALLVQRRRWANGGLLIVSKLLRYARATRLLLFTPLEIVMRLHYLISIAAGSLSLMVLLFIPLDNDLGSVWIPVTAAPYFLLYWRDLLQAGYRKGDVFRVYAFNMMLVPINVAGVVKSLQQGWTGRKSPFGRTPKVEGRTAAPGWAVAAEWLLLAYCLYAAVWDAFAGRWLHALFSLGTAVALGYAVTVFLGIGASREDLASGWQGLLSRYRSARLPWASFGSGGGGD